MSNPPYDLLGVLNSIATSGAIFVGTGELELLQTKIAEVVTIPVILFPFNEDGEITGSPRHYNFTGLLLSAFLTDKKTKGKFLFNDGTVVYYDKAILD